VRDPPAQLAVLVGTAEEIDDLDQLLLRVVDAGDVGEGDAVASRRIALRVRAGEGAEQRLRVRAPARDPDEQAEEEERRPEVEEDVLPPRQARLQRLRVDDDACLGQRTRECVGIGEFRNLGLEAGRALEPLYRSECLRTPWIAVPFEVISSTFPSAI
jgi:hypothetical protein